MSSYLGQFKDTSRANVLPIATTNKLSIAPQNGAKKEAKGEPLAPKRCLFFLFSSSEQSFFRGKGQVSASLIIIKIMNKLLKPEEVCEGLGICRRTLARYEDQDLIKPIKVNARVFRYDPADVAAMINNLKAKIA